MKIKHLADIEGSNLVIDEETDSEFYSDNETWDCPNEYHAGHICKRFIEEGRFNPWQFEALFWTNEYRPRSPTGYERVVLKIERHESKNLKECLKRIFHRVYITVIAKNYYLRKLKFRQENLKLRRREHFIFCANVIKYFKQKLIYRINYIRKLKLKKENKRKQMKMERMLDEQNLRFIRDNYNKIIFDKKELKMLPYGEYGNFYKYYISKERERYEDNNLRIFYANTFEFDNDCKGRIKNNYYSGQLMNKSRTSFLKYKNVFLKKIKDNAFSSKTFKEGWYVYKQVRNKNGKLFAVECLWIDVHYFAWLKTTSFFTYNQLNWRGLSKEEYSKFQAERRNRSFVPFFVGIGKFIYTDRKTGKEKTFENDIIEQMRQEYYYDVWENKDDFIHKLKRQFCWTIVKAKDRKSNEYLTWLDKMKRKKDKHWLSEDDDNYSDDGSNIYCFSDDSEF